MTGGCFDTDILLAKPNSVVAPITITYVKGDGTTITQNLDRPATSRTTIAARRRAHDAWDATGTHTERVTDTLATTWYFAEGSQSMPSRNSILWIATAPVEVL